MRKITKEELENILKKHKKWLNGDVGGKRADLSNVDLRGADLRGVDLRDSDLRGSDLRGANLINADLYGAYLSNACLSNANLRYTNLIDTDLRGANLSYANLHNANLKYANLSYANLSYANLGNAGLYNANLENTYYNECTSFYALQCPEKGSFIGFKKCDNYIVELMITEDAKRSSATSRKCRCSKAKVLSITNINGSNSNLECISSDRDEDFVYKVGEIVEVNNFDEYRWNECSAGIHFFITRDEAVRYNN